MRKPPHISIVTVVYNGEKYLEQTIKSVISQSYKNWEYIIIDGGSTDGTLDIIYKYKKYLSYWISEPDKGVYDAMNKGIGKCSGSYIALLNASDWYREDAFKSVAKMIVKKPKSDIFFSNIYIYDEVKRKKHLLTTSLSSNHILWLEMSVFHSTMFVKREVYNKIQYDTSYKIISDIKFVLLAIQNRFQFQYNPWPVTTYRLGGISSSGYKTLIEELRMKKELDYPKPLIYLSTITKALVMGYKLLRYKLNLSR